ncbi:MAG: metallophosphoesterase, partial [Planctomycetes bacterium]|nr:metallophosphoesterase [Planctomycetota bacterium]
DNLVALDRALAAFEDAGVETVIHAGDFCSPFALKMMLARLSVPLVAVFGNNDGERRGLARMLPDLCDGPRRFELADRKFCLLHDPAALAHEDEMASDIVVCGHTHEVQAELRNGTLYVNPGECCGWLSGLCRVSILDTATLAVQNQVVYEQERPGS